LLEKCDSLFFINLPESCKDQRWRESGRSLLKISKVNFLGSFLAIKEYLGQTLDFSLEIFFLLFWIDFQINFFSNKKIGKKTNQGVRKVKINCFSVLKFIYIKVDFIAILNFASDLSEKIMLIGNERIFKWNKLTNYSLFIISGSLEDTERDFSHWLQNYFAI